MRVAAVVIFVNAVGLIFFVRGRTERLLSAVVDPLHPDWSAMERAYAGFTLYAVSLFGILALGALLFAQQISRRRGGSLHVERPKWMSAAPVAALAVALTAAVVLVFIEVLIFQDYGVHFYEFDVFRILADAALRRDLGIQPAEVARVTFAAVGLLAAELVLCFAAARVAKWKNGAIARACATAMIVGVPGGLALFRSAEEGIGSARSEFEGALPLGRRLLFRTDSRPHIAVEPRTGAGGYPVIGPRDSAPALSRKSNIVFFVPDGLRADMIRPELTPNLLAFGARKDVIQSQRHFSSGHVSESGIFGLLYGVHGYAFHSFIGSRVPAYPIEVLKRNGYHTLFLSSSRLNPYPTDQLIRTFDEVEYPPNDDEAFAVLQRYIARRRADGKPYFVLAFFYTPHFPFTSAKPHLRRYPMIGPKARTNYMNDVIQTDDYFRQVFGLVRDDYDRGGTVFVVTSDHGEEIRDHGAFGHASATFWNEKIQVPFFAGMPQAALARGSKTPRLTAHVDVWPTLLDYLGASPRAEPRSYSDGRSLLANPEGSTALVTGRFFPFADRPSVLVAENRKYWFRVAGVGPNGRLCVEITRVTDLDDRPVSDLPHADPARIPGFEALQSTFWRFLRYTGPQTAPCSAVTTQ